MRSKQKLTQRIWLAPLTKQQNIHLKIVIFGESVRIKEPLIPFAPLFSKIEEYIPFCEPLPFEFEEAEVRDRVKMYEEYFENI